MSKFLDKIKGEVEESKMAEGLRRTKDQVKGIFHSDHRHDEPHEKERDKLRAEINASHRFESFAGERDGAHVKWHIDGHDYFWALSEIIDSAKSHIFILDWWLSPELYLRRPPAYYPEWRIDRLLKRKAEEGVKIYVIVYKEVTQTMTMSSRHTKHALEDLHENIAVMRHPDHIGAVDTTEFWSHHEKLVVVDNYKACVGGLDICFGRWDTASHPLADAHLTDFNRTLFPGQDYNDARFADFQNVDHYCSNTISAIEQPRMPWQDLHMTIVGTVVLDFAQHFIERWNEVKGRKYKHKHHFEWLSFPHDCEANPNEAIVHHPHREAWKEMGRQYKQRWFGPDAPPPEEQGVMPHDGSCHVQAVRSVSDWSHGVLTEHSIQNAYIEMINQAEHFIYIENQFFISNTGDRKKDPIVNHVAEAIVQRILRAAREEKKFRVIVIIPEAPCFAGSVQTTSISTILAGQYRTINRGGHSILEILEREGHDPKQYITFYHLRTYDRLNAPVSFIKQMEEASGVQYEDAQVAIAREWLGPDSEEDFTVKIKSVQPSAGDPSTMSSGKQTSDSVKEVKVPPTIEAARDIIKQFESGAPRSDEAVTDSISFHVQTAPKELKHEKWLGTEEEEKACYVSNLVYIHSKCMIVDDRRVIMGSANLNDRSQKGNGDSEIALVVDDTDMIESVMDGQPYKAGRFAATLRRKLCRKHLGLVDPQLCQSDQDPVTSFMTPSPIPHEDESELEATQFVKDPLDDAFMKQWRDSAMTNAEVFQELWKPAPSDSIRTWEQFKQHQPNVKPCHLVDESLDLSYIKERIGMIRGNLVEFQYDFLKDEKGWTSDESVDWGGYNPTLPIYV